MILVLLTALGVGGATILGSAVGFLFRNLSQRFSNWILAFAAGVMLAAAVVGLILPSLNYEGTGGILVTIAGIFLGAGCIRFLDRFVPQMQQFAGMQEEGSESHGVLLFVAAIAIHNFPEGIAAGVSFGTENTADALIIAAGIALHNLPEGMVIIAPMLAAGISPRRTFLCALATGLVEAMGTFLGYFAVTLASVLLPFALAFAGGTMLYVILDEMIPKDHPGICFLLGGFCVMLALDGIMG